jgi:hypothetical protein
MTLRVQLQLGTSQYGTMGLREACKRDGAVIQFGERKEIWKRPRREKKLKKLLHSHL